MDTLESETYDLGASHDLTPVSGETMVYFDYTEADCDSVHEIDPSGVDVEVFEGEGIIEGSGMTGCHLNALRYSAKEDVYTISDVMSDIYIVNRDQALPADQRLEWRLSTRVGSNADWGGSNHGHQLLDESILIFGNRGGANNASCVFEYTLDGDEIMRYDSGLTASNLGDVQRLPGGNTLISYSNNDSYIHEIDASGRLVLEIDLGAGGGIGGPALGYILWRQSLYGPPPDIGM